MPSRHAHIAPPSRERTFERLPDRVLSLLHGIAKHPSIRARMIDAGYTRDIQRQGFALLEAALGLGMELDEAPLAPPSPEPFDAVSEWYVSAFERVQAALAHLHPTQGAYVTHGLVPATDAAAVVACGVFLDRLADLAGTGPHAEVRATSRAQDARALATLASRGFGASELGRARTLVEAAERAVSLPRTEAVDPAEERRRLVALKAWYDDWSATARRVIDGRADRIRLGLAHKQAPAD